MRNRNDLIPVDPKLDEDQVNFRFDENPEPSVDQPPETNVEGDIDDLAPEIEAAPEVPQTPQGKAVEDLAALGSQNDRLAADQAINNLAQSTSQKLQSSEHYKQEALRLEAQRRQELAQIDADENAATADLQQKHADLLKRQEQERLKREADLQKELNVELQHMSELYKSDAQYIDPKKIRAKYNKPLNFLIAGLAGLGEAAYGSGDPGKGIYRVLGFIDNQMKNEIALEEKLFNQKQTQRAKKQSISQNRYAMLRQKGASADQAANTMITNEYGALIATLKGMEATAKSEKAKSGIVALQAQLENEINTRNAKTNEAIQAAARKRAEQKAQQDRLAKVYSAASEDPNSDANIKFDKQGNISGVDVKPNEEGRKRKEFEYKETSKQLLKLEREASNYERKVKEISALEGFKVPGSMMEGLIDRNWQQAKDYILGYTELTPEQKKLAIETLNAVAIVKKSSGDTGVISNLDRPRFEAVLRDPKMISEVYDDAFKANIAEREVLYNRYETTTGQQFPGFGKYQDKIETYKQNNQRKQDATSLKKEDKSNIRKTRDQRNKEKFERLQQLNIGIGRNY